MFRQMTEERRPKKRFRLLVLFSLLSNIQPIWADSERVSLGSGFDLSSGKYGGTTATDMTYIPVTGKYETRDWLYKLTVPYIQITGPGNTLPNIGQTVYASNAVRTDAGLGDVVASTTYTLANSARDEIAIDLTGKIKFGTADKSKGLGTGANDYAAETTAYKMIGRYDAFGTIGYKVFGQSLGYTLNNTFYGSIGAAYKFDDKTSFGTVYDYRNQTSMLVDPMKIWTVFVNRKINRNWKGQTYLFKGFGNFSPDIGGGAMLTRVF